MTIRRTLLRALITPCAIVASFGASYGLVEFAETFDTTDGMVTVEWSE